MKAQSALASPASIPRFLGLWVGTNLVGGFVVGLLENNGLQFMATLAVTALGGVYQPVADWLWQSFGLWEVFWLNLVREPLAVAGMPLAQGWIWQRRGRFFAGQAAPTAWGWLGVSLLGGALQGAVSATLCAVLCPILPSLLVGLVHGLGWTAYGLATGIWLVRQRAGIEESL